MANILQKVGACDCDHKRLGTGLQYANWRQTINSTLVHPLTAAPNRSKNTEPRWMFFVLFHMLFYAEQRHRLRIYVLFAFKNDERATNIYPGDPCKIDYACVRRVGTSQCGSGWDVNSTVPG